MQTDLERRVAVVTGATSGIGEAVARLFASQRTRVCIVGRRKAILEKLVEELGSSCSLVAVPVDLNASNAPKLIKEAVLEAFGRVDVLIHCAALHFSGSFAASLDDTFESLISTNVIAPYRLTKALLHPLSDAQGDIVFVNSSVTRHPRAQIAQFAASKHALAGLANCLRAELNGIGIRVLSIYPGRTATPLTESLYEQKNRKYDPESLLQPEDVAAVILNAVALSRTAEVTDIYLRPRLRPVNLGGRLDPTTTQGRVAL